MSTQACTRTRNTVRLSAHFRINPAASTPEHRVPYHSIVAMEIDLTDAVESHADRLLLWQRLLHPSAVAHFLGGEATDARPLDTDDNGAAHGHTFRIKGVGGGVFHARIDRQAEHTMVAYVVWSERMPESPLLLTYTIDASADRTLLRGVVAMDIPVEEVLASFGPLALIMKPFAPELTRRFSARQLRKQLIAIAAQTRSIPGQ